MSMHFFNNGRLVQRLLLYLVAGFVSMSCVYPPKGIRNNSGQIPVTFNYADSSAEKVCVCGDFNQWSPVSHCMTKKENHRWSLEMSLSPGRYRYVLVIDDQVWKTDPGAVQTEESGFGTRNSILIVG